MSEIRKVPVRQGGGSLGPFVVEVFVRIVFLSPSPLFSPVRSRSRRLLRQSRPSFRRVALPVVFSKTLSADKSRRGRPHPGQDHTSRLQVERTGRSCPSGTELLGHVTALRFRSSTTRRRTHFSAKQATLSIHFDAIRLAGQDLFPCRVTVRAMADPISSWEARREARSTDLDPSRHGHTDRRRPAWFPRRRRSSIEMGTSSLTTARRGVRAPDRTCSTAMQVRTRFQ